MKKLIALWIMALWLPALAQMGSHLKEEFQDPEKHGIRVVEQLSALRGVMHDDTVRIICLQTLNELLDPALQAELLDWVRGGRTVWFYDAQMASQFGMRTYLLESEQFRSKPEKGVLGGSKRHGLATVAISFGQHPVQTGVGQVTVFLPGLLSEGSETPSYGAVEVVADTIPLLQFALDSPALMALRREGRGLIVFKALLWNEPLSGDRFQANLLDFSAGFQVPGPAGVGKVGMPPGPDAEYAIGEPAEPLALGEPVLSPATRVANTAQATTASPPVGQGGWRLELKDGTVVTGELEGSVLQFETGTGSLKLKPDEIRALEFGSSVKLDRITTVKGKSESGVFMSSPFKFRTERGVETFEKEDVHSLHRGGAPDAPQGDEPDDTTD